MPLLPSPLLPYVRRFLIRCLWAVTCVKHGTKGAVTQSVAALMALDYYGDTSMNSMDDLLEKFREFVKNGHYNVKEFGKLDGVQRSGFTVRQWCNLGRINAQESGTRCGPCCTWSISHEEYLRFKKEGLLPIDPARNNPDRKVGRQSPVSAEDGRKGVLLRGRV